MSTWTIKHVLDWAAEDFKSKKMDRPRFEAEVLLAHVLSLSRLDLYTKFDYPLNDPERERFRDAISKRRSGEPVAHITGQKEFWSLEFEVDKNVLVPRPETEILVESAIKVAPKKGRFLDLCTGSGCVAIALAKELPDVSIDAVDISRDACEVAARNAKKHSVDNRVHSRGSLSGITPHLHPNISQPSGAGSSGAGVTQGSSPHSGHSSSLHLK